MDKRIQFADAHIMFGECYADIRNATVVEDDWEYSVEDNWMDKRINMEINIK